MIFGKERYIPLIAKNNSVLKYKEVTLGTIFQKCCGVWMGALNFEGCIVLVNKPKTYHMQDMCSTT